MNVVLKENMSEGDFLSSKRTILLLSGGFDSTIAGYLLQKNNYKIVPLHLSNVDFVGEDSIDKAIEVAKKLSFHQLYVIDIADALQEFVNKCKHSYYFVLMKRFMLRLAAIIAEKENARYIATGESLGQVSSQTLTNISVIENATSVRVLKPLITFDKEKIIKLTRNLGFFDISAGPEVCDFLGPKHPITNANLDTTLKEETRIDMSKIIENCMKTLKIKDLS